MYPTNIHYTIHQNDHQVRLGRSALRRLVDQPVQRSTGWLRWMMMFFL